ncbi:MAG: hypothetical protein JNK14_02275 [Chitinophagaceae bacterium]|nr:hypothetical protein [Chitinophagaceae bacterium]
MNKPRFLVLISTVLILAGCTSNEIGNLKDVNPESIYFDYTVWGDEESGEVTVKLQYRFAGPNGTTLVLDDPSKVELDGVAISVDSSKMNGAYYEVTRPVKEFAGKHSIVFTDPNKKQYKEEFHFQPIQLVTQLPAVITRGDMVLEVQGLAPKDYVRILMTDTAFYSEGIARVDTVENGRIHISKEALSRLTSGPVHLQLSREDEKWVKNGTREGGRLSVSYGLKREFELKDNTPNP